MAEVCMGQDPGTISSCRKVQNAAVPALSVVLSSFLEKYGNIWLRI